MLNMLKMDFHRLLRTRSLYVIWLIFFAMVAFNTYMGVDDYITLEVGETEEVVQGDNKGEGFALVTEIPGEKETVNVGISAYPPTKPGEKVTVFDLFYMNAQCKSIALFLAIFVILFTSGDISSGYIKNVAGQVKHRGYLVLSKMVILALYTVVTLGLTIVVQAVSNRIVLGYLEWGNGGEFVKYFLLQLMLHIALAAICMAVTIIVRNNVFSMIFSIALCMNLWILLYMGIDKLIHKVGFDSFTLLDYSVTGNIFQLPMEISRQKGLTVAAVSVVFLVVMLVLSGVLFEKRDVS